MSSNIFRVGIETLTEIIPIEKSINKLCQRPLKVAWPVFAGKCNRVNICIQN